MSDILDRLRPWSEHDPQDLDSSGPNETLIKDAMDEIKRLRAEVEGMTAWQPIETAPRDGTRVLFWDVKQEVAISGHWHSDPGTDNPTSGYEPAWAWWVSDDDLILWEGSPGDEPAAWMPLPVPPVTDKPDV